MNENKTCNHIYLDKGFAQKNVIHFVKQTVMAGRL